MNDQKFIIQIINAESGNRSKPFQANWEELKKSLQKAGEALNPEDYILLVAAVKGTGDEQQMQLAETPLIKIETFLEMFEIAQTEGN